MSAGPFHKLVSFTEPGFQDQLRRHRINTEPPGAGNRKSFASGARAQAFINQMGRQAETTVKLPREATHARGKFGLTFVHVQRKTQYRARRLPFGDDALERAPVRSVVAVVNSGQGRGRAGKGLTHGDTDTVRAKVEPEQNGQSGVPRLADDEVKIDAEQLGGGLPASRGGETKQSGIVRWTAEPSVGTQFLL